MNLCMHMYVCIYVSSCHKISCSYHLISQKKETRNSDSCLPNAHSPGKRNIFLKRHGSWVVHQDAGVHGIRLGVYLVDELTLVLVDELEKVPVATVLHQNPQFPFGWNGRRGDRFTARFTESFIWKLLIYILLILDSRTLMWLRQ